jgi:TonB family protein
MRPLPGKAKAPRPILDPMVDAVDAKHGAGHGPKTDAAVVDEKLRALFGDGDGIGHIFGPGASSALNVALDGVATTTVASPGPQLRGAIGIGDQPATGTISVGVIHTRGGTAGRGDDRSLDGDALGEKQDRDIVIPQTPVCLVGTLDPELIRRVVRAHVGQVRYCYERALSSTPGLAGRVSVQWTINAEGHVTASSIESTSLHNSEVEACLIQRVKTWRFPSPKDGGVVVVKYPFVLNRAGGQ